MKGYKLRACSLCRESADQRPQYPTTDQLGALLKFFSAKKRICAAAGEQENRGQWKTFFFLSSPRGGDKCRARAGSGRVPVNAWLEVEDVEKEEQKEWVGGVRRLDVLTLQEELRMKVTFCF